MRPGPPGDPGARLFVALELPARVSSTLARLGAACAAADPALRASAEGSLHVTLCFLGAQPAAAVPEILEAVTRATAERGEAVLSAAEALWLPPRRPGVLAVRLEDEGGVLAGVQAALASALVGGGWYAAERRAYLPHVTVARVRRGARAETSRLPPLEPLRFRGERVALMRSHLSPAGARYERLGGARLGGAGA